MKINLCKLYTFLFVLDLLILVLSTGRMYNGLNKGIAWNHGGVEILPSPAVFLCSGSYDESTGKTQEYHYSALIESLIVDC